MFQKDIVMHEIGHAIGLYHEHSRKDRGDHVAVIDDNIIEKYKFNFDKGDIISNLAVPYDLTSLMHYGSRVSIMVVK